METDDEQWKRIYNYRLKGRADLVRLLDDQVHAACVGACGDCPLGLKLPMKLGHAPCAISIIQQLVQNLVPIKTVSKDDVLAEIIADETELITQAAAAFERGDRMVMITLRRNRST